MRFCWVAQWLAAQSLGYGLARSGFFFPILLFAQAGLELQSALSQTPK
jgi:hypothetical protein